MARWAYHGTSRRRLRRICRDGLVPEISGDAVAGSAPVVYFADKVEGACCYAPPRDKLILRFPWPRDAEWDDNRDEWQDAVTYRRVPPAFIERLVRGEWRPLHEVCP